MASQPTLSLKNPQAYQLARELADLTGESMTAAVVRALELRLEQERAQRRPRRDAAAMLAFGKRFAEHVRPGCSSAGLDAFLYDENGLPK